MRQYSRRQRRRVTNLQFTGAESNFAGGFYSFIRALQDRPRFTPESTTSLRKSDGFGAPFQQEKTKLSLKVADLPAQRRLGQVQFCRRAGNILFLGNRDEIAKVAQFH